MEASSHSPQDPKDLLPASQDTLRSYLSIPTPIKSMLVALMAEILALMLWLVKMTKLFLVRCFYFKRERESVRETDCIKT